MTSRFDLCDCSGVRDCMSSQQLVDFVREQLDSVSTYLAYRSYEETLPGIMTPLL